MGTNNRKRRAAKAKRRRQAVSRPTASQCFCPEHAAQAQAQRRAEPVRPADPQPDVVELRGYAQAFAANVLSRLARQAVSPALVADEVLRPDARLPAALVVDALRRSTVDQAAAATARGWAPSDLAQVVRRQLGDDHVPHLLSVVTEVTRQRPAGEVSQQWAQDLKDAGRPCAAVLGSRTGLTYALGIAGLLGRLPAIAPVLDVPGRARTPVDPVEAKVLARVRALLAKAESTQFQEEAEALSAKAQELISRHALEALLATNPDEEPTDIVTARLWVDPPYVLAKAHLVHAVAQANHCRAVVSKELECCTLVGTRRDLAAVELLVTSLFIQANAAMLRHGSQTDVDGRSRTASFRQSFLLSYAHRIGERLLHAGWAAAEETGRGGELVPVLHRHDDRVEEATRLAMPHTTTARAASVSNRDGVVAGRAAADRAQLDPRRRIAG